MTTSQKFRPSQMNKNRLTSKIHIAFQILNIFKLLTTFV